jgi:hypothetical protein
LRTDETERLSPAKARGLPAVLARAADEIDDRPARGGGAEAPKPAKLRAVSLFQTHPVV